jgi:outer membrane protein
MIRKRSKNLRTMKKLLLSALVLMFFAGSTLAQKFAFVDSDYILQNIPSYKAAQDELDKVSETWEAEISTAYEQIEQMYKTYQSERVLLTDDMRKKREEDIVTKEHAVKELSAEGSYAIIFDTSSGASILYSNPRYDLSDEVLKKLGYKN